jgi:hypothetical protein
LCDESYVCQSRRRKKKIKTESAHPHQRFARSGLVSRRRQPAEAKRPPQKPVPADVSWWAKYSGPHIPSPLEIGVDSDSNLSERTREILTLTKMNLRLFDMGEIASLSVSLPIALRDQAQLRSDVGSSSVC